MGTKKWKVDMKDIRDMLALAAKDRYSAREIAASLGISHQSVTRHLARIAEAGLGVEQARELTDEALGAICHPASPGPRSGAKAMPDLDAIIAELAKPNAPTRKVLWEEYREQYQEAGYGYSQFAGLIRHARSMNTLTMHLEHVPADKLFIDFAGDKVGIYSSPGATEPDYEASIFVATLAYSGKTFAWATRYQDVASVIDATERALYSFGGVVARLVPDNMATAVIAARGAKGALKLNSSFKEFANHLGTLIAPTRVRKPRDKARVEQMVGYVERDVLGRLRNRRFYSIEELNVALEQGLARLNAAKLQGQDFSRDDRFLEAEAGALAALPGHKFQFGLWSRTRAGSNYHVKVAKSYYSVPWRLAHCPLTAKATVGTVEIYDGTSCVAIHPRSMLAGGYVTNQAHMPPDHLAYARSTSVEGLMAQIAAIGPSAVAFADAILARVGSTGLAMASLAQIAEVGRAYGAQVCERSAAHAIAIGATRSSSLASIAAKGLFDEDPAHSSTAPSVIHNNIRGPRYYGGAIDVG